jgi:hypothetical protein
MLKLNYLRHNPSRDRRLIAPRFLPAPVNGIPIRRSDNRHLVSSTTPWLMLIDRRGFQRRSRGGLCVEVSVPVSPCFRPSIPVGLRDDGRGLCVELVLPISCPEESCPEEGLGAPPVFSAKDTVVGPMKRAIATTAAPMLRCILHS